MKKKVLVLGASPNSQRVAHTAAELLMTKGFETVLVGRRDGRINGVAIQTNLPQIKDIDTITLYMGEKAQKEHYDYILSLNPQRVIFNPGAENPELADRLKKENIAYENACTLVLLHTNNF